MKNILVRGDAYVYLPEEAVDAILEDIRIGGGNGADLVCLPADLPPELDLTQLVRALLDRRKFLIRIFFRLGL